MWDNEWTDSTVVWDDLFHGTVNSLMVLHMVCQYIEWFIIIDIYKCNHFCLGCWTNLVDASTVAIKNVPTSYDARLYDIWQQINCITKGSIPTTLPMLQ